jgi:sensor histidine kinase regulating citrate/malate metabolism
MKTIGGRKVEQCLLLSGVSFASSVTITVQLSYLMKLQAKEFYIYLLPSVFFIGLVFFIIVFFRIMLKAQENMRTIAVYNNQMNLFSQQYDALVRSNKEIINLRHDWQHHLDIIGGLIYDNETEKLKSYINNLTDIVENNHTTYIGEPVIDIILSGLVHSAKESGVEVDIITDMKFKLNITLTDLCILISNSVDNALEACEKMESEHDKKIWIGIKTDEHYLFYTIKNTYHGEILKISSRILSTKDKPEQHGIGLQSIERIVEKYDGHTVIAENNGIFEIICALENKQITEYAR